MPVPPGVQESTDEAVTSISEIADWPLERVLAWADSVRTELPPESLEMLETTRKAARSFLKDHLGRFGTAFGLRLSREDAGGVFGLLAELLLSLLRLESERLGVALGAATLDLRSAAEDEVPMGCGSGEQLVQIQTRRNAGQSPTDS